EQEIGTRRGLGDGEEIGELLIRQPMLRVDNEAMRVGKDDVHAAERKERQQREPRRHLGEDVAGIHAEAFTCCRHQAMATLSGASTSITSTSGKRRMPTPRNAA